MSELKGKNIYMVLYNYVDRDFSIIKICEYIETAFQYICNQQHLTYFDKQKNFKMLEINNPKEINNLSKEYINVCYIAGGKYTNLDLEDKDHISQYIIVPMKIE